MAVPPPLAKAIFAAILKSFAGVEYQSVDPNLQHHVPGFSLSNLAVAPKKWG